MADRSVFVRLRASVNDYVRDMGIAAGATQGLETRLRSLDQAGNAIDRTSGRVGLLVDALLLVGPAAAPITAVAVPALTTMVSSLGFVTLAAGTTALAFGGVGDALEKLNEARLDPTKENLKEAKEALEGLSPAAEDFVRKLDSMRGLGRDLRDAGAEELFPGLIRSLDSLEERAPDGIRLIRRLNREVGDIAADSAADLSSRRWDDFFRLLNREGPRTLDSLATSLGNVAHGGSEILEAFAPLNRDGLGWVEDITADFDQWATGLKHTDGFKDFVDYIRENGPQVAETFGSIAGAAAAIGEAAAPLGGPVLRGIEGVADAVAAVAESEYGTELLLGLTAYRLTRRARNALPGLGGGVVQGVPAGPLGGMSAGPVPVIVMNPGFAMPPGTPVPGGPAGKPAPSTPGTKPAPKPARPAPSGSLLNKLPFAPLLGEGLIQGVESLGIGERAGPGSFRIHGLNGQLGDFIQGGGFGRTPDRPQTTVDDLGKTLAPGGFMAGIKLDVEAGEAADVRAEIEKVTSKPYKASVELEDQRARRVAQGVHRMLDDVASQRPTPKIDADPKPATGKSNGVKRLLDEIAGKKPRPTINANDKASPVINRVSGLLAGLDGRTANTTVTTTYVRRFVGGRSDTPGFGPDMEPSADGGTVPDDGGGYRDYLTAFVAPREEIVSDRYGGASKNRAALKAASKGARLAVVGYADGGTAGWAPDPTYRSGGGGRGSLAAMTVTGTLQTPWGPAQIRGMARDEARKELDAQDRWERDQAR